MRLSCNLKWFISLQIWGSSAQLHDNGVRNRKREVTRKAEEWEVSDKAIWQMYLYPVTPEVCFHYISKMPLSRSVSPKNRVLMTILQREISNKPWIVDSWLCNHQWCWHFHCNTTLTQIFLPSSKNCDQLF